MTIPEEVRYEKRYAFRVTFRITPDGEYEKIRVDGGKLTDKFNLFFFNRLVDFFEDATFTITQTDDELCIEMQELDPFDV